MKKILHFFSWAGSLACVWLVCSSQTAVGNQNDVITGQIQEHPAWCVYSCLNACVGQSQCHYATLHRGMFLDPPGSTTEDCCNCSTPGGWTNCLRGVNSYNMMQFLPACGITNVVRPMRFDDLCRLLERDPLARYNVTFPMFAMVDYGNGDGHCIVLVAIDYHFGDYRYFDPAYGDMRNNPLPYNLWVFSSI